jgi:adenosylmethionine-8-amino-7-oxononanoate aminotransferase
MARDPATHTPFAWQERRGRRVYRHALEHGVLLRPLGDVVYLMPPYVVTTEQIDAIAAVAARGIDAATRD